MSETRTGNGTGKLIAALLSLGLIYLGEIGGYLFSIVTGGDFDICVTMGGAIVAVLVFIALGGIRYLSFDVKAIIEAWKFMWWMILLSALLMVWDLYDYIAAGEVVHAGWFVRCVSSLVLCLAIGVHEEGMFRGVLFGGLLARLGEKKNGIWWAVGLSSLAFGCAHVTPYDLDVNNWLTFVQAFLKIIQTGIYAVMLCAVVLKTQNLIGAMVVHALDDWLLFVVSTGLFGESFETEYVVQDADEGVYTIIFYLIIIALYMPTFIKALLEIRKIQAPQFGPFITPRKLEPVTDEGYLSFQQGYEYASMAPQQLAAAADYQPQVVQPMHQQPSYQQPVYQQPVYQQPVYQQPVQQQPYQQPVQQQPYQQQPAYQQPYQSENQQPVYQPQPYQQPTYQPQPYQQPYGPQTYAPRPSNGRPPRPDGLR
jgi:hypothetical protein